MNEFEMAKDKVMMGTERRSMVMTDEEKELTAYHEAGHALVGLAMPKSDPLHKVTIIPRGRALGVTMSLPERDKYTYSKLELESKLAMMFGGRAAEEIVFGAENITTGAGNDIKEATAMARRMVTEYGFSEKLGPLRYTDSDEEVFLGHSVTQHKSVSDATAKLIDDEVRSLIDISEQKALKILREQREGLNIVTKALLEYETLTGEEVKTLLRGQSIVRPDPDDIANDGRRKSSVPTSGSLGKGRLGGLDPEPQPGT
jgi:cell division protease FtsH